MKPENVLSYCDYTIFYLMNSIAKCHVVHVWS